MPALFSKKLAHLRNERHLTQIEVGRALALASSALVNHLEVGRRDPSINVVLGLANFFNVSTDYLILDTIAVEPVVNSVLGPSPVPPQLLGTKVRFLRTHRGYTQIGLAHQLGLRTQAHISHIEAGRHEASLELVLKLVRIFDVTSDYFLRDTIAKDSVI